MSREFSVMGLPKEFEEFKEENDLRVVSHSQVKEYFHGDGYSFKTYLDNRGNLYEEFEAGCPWRSGPELYLGLRLKGSKEEVFSWSRFEMGIQEDNVILEGYDREKKLVEQYFVKKEEGPHSFGYCPLYIKIEKDMVDIYQTNSKNDDQTIGIEIKLLKESDGELIRDWLFSEGYSVEVDIE